MYDHNTFTPYTAASPRPPAASPAGYVLQREAVLLHRLLHHVRVVARVAPPGEGLRARVAQVQSAGLHRGLHHTAVRANLPLGPRGVYRDEVRRNTVFRSVKCYDKN